MSDYNSRQPRGGYEYDDRPRRSTSSGTRSGEYRGTGSRPAGSHSAGTHSAGSRPAGSRPAGTHSAGSRPSGSRPSGSRPSGSHRPPQGSRRPQRRRRRTQPKFYLIAAIALALIIALVIIIIPKNGGDKTVTQAQQTQQTQTQTDLGFGGVTVAPQETEQKEYTSLAEQLADSDAEVEALDESERVKVETLSVNESLPSEWLNVLLLGTDERYLNENSRTDAMLICSINTTTGQVKLASIMRDTAITIEGLPAEYGKNFRINSANYFGGPEYAMKVINENLQMNIQNYVMVNFFGFSKIASKLGGVEIDITEAEMNEINENAISQAYDAQDAGVDESDLEAAGENVLLTTYGKNTHLNGRQTLAYARIRHLDSDASRTERQRKVLTALLGKVKQMGVSAISLIPSMIGNVSTNMSADTIAKVATVVLTGDISNVETLRLPINGSYKQETRNEQDMLWDTDWNANANELYNFIYG